MALENETLHLLSRCRLLASCLHVGMDPDNASALGTSTPVVTRSDGQTYAVVEKLPRGGKAIIFLFFSPNISNFSIALR